MTNADKLRSMTDEELAKVIDDSLKFFSCDECDRPVDNRNGNTCCDNCESWILKFLRSEANA